MGLTGGFMCAALAAALIAVAAGPAPAALAQPAMTGSAAAGTCKPVWFIAARGSGESARGDAGMGKELYYMASVASSALAKEGVAMASMAVDYPADSVYDLKPNSTVLALLNQDDVAAAFAEYKQTSVDKYDASMTQGIKQAEADVAAVLDSCPGAEIIMGGYSQGAVAVHDAENWLAVSKPAEFKHIAGTLLLADPDRVPYTKARRFGDSAAKAEGLRVYLHLVKAHDVPAPATTANIANTGDMVADFQGVPSLENAKADAAVHTSYATTVTGKRVLASAANWVVGNIRPVITTAKLPAATVGKPYSAALTTADHRTGTWKITAGKLPPGLALSGYTVSGTPDTAGTYKFTLSFTDTHARTAAAAGTLTVADAKWVYSVLPLPANAGGFFEPGVYGVSCPSASFCVAVGSYSDTSERNDAMLLTRSDDSWTAAEAPVPAGATGAALNAVSCPSALFCVAVGHFAGTSGGQSALLLTWAGGSWTAAQAPLPADSASRAYASLDAVSCPSASFCTAVGYYDDDASGQSALLLTWAGGSWTAAKAPLPADSASPAGAGLDAVSCPSASFCVAGGNYTGGDTASLMLTWSDGSWTATRPFTGHQGWLTGVSCPSASFCTAVGDYLVPTTTWDYRPEVLTWSGSRWAAAPGPIPSGAVDVTWGSVSCPSSSYCAATGLVNYDPSSFEWQDLVRTWWGGPWTETSFPQAPSLVDASCWSAGDCVVIGTTGPGGGDPIALTSSS